MPLEYTYGVIIMSVSLEIFVCPYIGVGINKQE